MCRSTIYGEATVIARQKQAIALNFNPLQAQEIAQKGG